MVKKNLILTLSSSNRYRVGKKNEDMDPSMINTESTTKKGFDVVKYTINQMANKKRITPIDTQMFFFAGSDDHWRNDPLVIVSCIMKLLVPVRFLLIVVGSGSARWADCQPVFGFDLMAALNTEN